MDNLSAWWKECVARRLPVKKYVTVGISIPEKEEAKKETTEKIRE